MINLRKILPYTLFALLFVSLFQSCVKDKLEEIDTRIDPVPIEIISTSVYGQILDKAGDAVGGATVSLMLHQGQEMRAVTDNNGNFDFIQVLNPGSSAFIKVEASGYFDGYRRLSVLRNNFNYTRVKLLEKTIVGEIPSGSGGSASTVEGMSVTLPADAVSLPNGGAYSGAIRVAMAWIDPSAEDLPDLVIGDLSGIGEDGQASSLASFGMVNVELLANDGQELKIKDGMEATLSFPLPPERLKDAPGTIPLWSYDENEGTWVEESSASLVGDKYVGDVTHFSSWNVDWKGERISVNGCVSFNQNNRSSNMGAQVFVCSPLLGTKGGWLCPDGKFLFYNFPKDEAFTLKIKDECGNVVYEESYGPFSADTEIPKINVSVNPAEVITVSGSAVDCDGNAVTNGYVNATADNGSQYFVYLDNNGAFELNLLTCLDPETLELRIIDIDNALGSETISITLGLDDINLGVIEVCDELPEFIQLEIVDVFSNVYLGAFYWGPLDRFGAVDEDSIGNWYNLEFSALNPQPLGPGTAVADSFFLYQFEQDVRTNVENTSPSNVTVTYTSYGTNPGDIIRGSFIGEVEVNHGQVDLGIKEINGTFKIIHD